MIPADGFYEWKRIGRAKQPYFFQLQNESPFAFAGLWDEWQGDGASITSCSIVTTTPNELMATIHDRMPVILTTEGQKEWLRRDALAGKLKELLSPFPASEMKSFPVHSRVGNSLIDEARLIEPADPIQEMTSGRLF